MVLIKEESPNGVIGSDSHYFAPLASMMGGWSYWWGSW